MSSMEDCAVVSSSSRRSSTAPIASIVWPMVSPLWCECSGCVDCIFHDDGILILDGKTALHHASSLLLNKTSVTLDPIYPASPLLP